MTIEQLMDKAEALNMISDGLKIQVDINDFEDIDKALELCKQQDGTVFEPNGVSGYLWCTFFLGDIDFNVKGKKMTREQLKNYYINSL
jgi:hypothetical protein